MLANQSDDTSAQAAGPLYADLRSLRLESVGDQLRVIVIMGDPEPAKLKSGEVMGVGIDFYRGDEPGDSAYQLFADGESDGWYAYLDTPNGFVQYPGTIDLAEGGLVFTIPWSALGNLTSGKVSAFCDWSDGAGHDSSDKVPDSGRVAFSR